MNPQPFQTPPRWWPSLLSPRLVRWYRPLRNRELRQQGIHEVDVRDSQIVGELLQAGHGVLLVSNHSYHYDSYVLIEAGLRGGWNPQIMTAWQVFALYRRPGQWFLQKHGCFSVNREGTDTQALRHAVSVLNAGPYPLVIFPEGDIYHSNDRVLPFREGAAAVALMAQKKKVRPIVVVPCAMKCFYTVDPTPQLISMMDHLESHIRWRPRSDLPLLERIYRFGNGFLSLKEVEYLGVPGTGAVRDRLQFLAESIVSQICQRHAVNARGNDLTDRIRWLRGYLIKLIDEIQPARSKAVLTPEQQQQRNQLHEDMEDLFFVTQLTSYHGDYSSEKPTVERMAETIDKFEEDVFALQAPTPRGRRRAVVRFGSPLHLADKTFSTSELTLTMERSVQGLLDEINADEEQALGVSSQ